MTDNTGNIYYQENIGSR